MPQMYTQRRRAAAESVGAERMPESAGGLPPEVLAGRAAPGPELMGSRADLPEAVRSKMESSFGADFSGVQLYESQAVADAGAQAVTMGNRIAFAPGELDFSSTAGQALLGHELSHVVSQARGEVSGAGFLNDHALEARADREGAMAAAGEGVYAGPVTPVSASSVSAAAGPMQAKKPRSKNDITAAPGEVQSENFRSIKAGNSGSSVAEVGTAGGGSAILKMGTNPQREQLYSDYYNLAGAAFGRGGGSWSFDAPAARGVTQAERSGAVGQMVAEGKLSSLSTQESGELSGLDSATVYAKANGGSAASVDAAHRLKDPAERAEYRRALGYVSVMDAVTGNADRTLAMVAPENWMEDMDSRSIHLIDHDFMANGGLSGGRAERGNWLNKFMNWTAPHAYGGEIINNGRHSPGCFAAGLWCGRSEPTDRDYFSGPKEDQGSGTRAGVEQAFADLPGLREQLRERFQKQDGGRMNEYQTELLERMQIASESMDPELQPIYHELGQIGLDARPGEAAETAQRRSALLSQRDALRTAKSYGGQTHGARPTAASGDGWTKGSAADWLGYGGQTHGGRPTAVSGSGWTKGTAADWLNAPAAAPAAKHRRRRR